MKDRARNSARGLKAKQVGDAFEDFIKGEHAKAVNLGIIAHVQKNEPHAEVLGGRLVYTSAGVADFTGTLEGGRSLAEECKSTADERFPRNEISVKQQEHLEATARAGALALLLVEFRIDGIRRIRYAIPWLEVPWKVARTAESIVLKDMREEWCILEEKCYLLRYHPGGPRSGSWSPVKRRVFARE